MQKKKKYHHILLQIPPMLSDTGAKVNYQNYTIKFTRINFKNDFLGGSWLTNFIVHDLHTYITFSLEKRLKSVT